MKSSDPGLNAIMFGFTVTAAFIIGSSRVIGDAASDCKSRQITVEDRARYSPLVLHTLAVYTNPCNVAELADRAMPYSAHFWLISAYKGAHEIARYFKIPETDDVAVYNIHDR